MVYENNKSYSKPGSTITFFIPNRQRKSDVEHLHLFLDADFSKHIKIYSVQNLLEKGEQGIFIKILKI